MYVKLLACLLHLLMIKSPCKVEYQYVHVTVLTISYLWREKESGNNFYGPCALQPICLEICALTRLTLYLQGTSSGLCNLVTRHMQ